MPKLCEPITLAVAFAGIAAASSAVGIIGQNKAMVEEAENANVAAMADYAALEDQAKQTGDQARAEAARIKLNNMREEATIRTATGENGMGGASSLREVQAAHLAASGNISVLETNYANTLQQNAREIGKIAMTNRGRVGAARSRMVGAAAAGLQIGAAGMQGAASGYSLGKSYQEGKKPNAAA